MAITIAIATILLGQISYASSSNSTVPYTVSYSAKLADSSGNPITTTRNIRFSLWKSAAFTNTDLQINGAINTGAGNYSGWQEVHTVTPDSKGLFTVRLGSINSLPNFNNVNQINLQVEIKTVASPDTSYEILDPSGSIGNGTDRFTLSSSAFAINADTVDNADVGTDPTNIPQLDANGLLPIGTIPGGSNGLNFTINNNDLPGNIGLQFGTSLGKILSYDTTNSYFSFNDSLNIQGDLTVTGTINGQIVGPHSQSMVYEAQYGDALISQDGTQNFGKVETFFDAANNLNWYKWTTQQSSPQNIDLILRVELPPNFLSFDATPITFDYQTSTANLAENKLDVTLLDATNTPVSLNNANSLNSINPASTSITFNGSPIFSAGQTITVKIKLSSTDLGAAFAGKLSLNITGS